MNYKELMSIAEEMRQKSIKPVDGFYEIEVPVEVIDNAMAEAEEYALKVFAADEKKKLSDLLGSAEEEKPARRL